jgi:transcription-repair coupling factor (superfamily II helicase)
MVKPEELIQGSYYIQASYGICIYMGLKEAPLGGVKHCFMFRDNKGYYIDNGELNGFYKYGNVGNNPPRLDSLVNRKSWRNRKQKSMIESRKQAKELLQIYKNRANTKGFAFSKDTLLQKQFEKEVPFTLSPGQFRCMNEIKRDMESDKSMDRLLCGDVGYGKTELAMRAAFKAVQDGKQVVILTPSRILSKQHYNDFIDRFKGYNVKIGLLTSQRNKRRTKLLKDIEDGNIDIIIGTQNVVSKCVKYHDIGLMVIDEEHRLGVATKEKIKAISANVDVLSMSGTPIPRTLNLTKLHIRDISIIDTPPANKKAPITESCSWNNNKIKFVIERELNRDGQIFLVDNNINELYVLRDYVEKLVPGIRTGIVHGKMRQNEIDNIMEDMLDKKIDLLLASTVIEVGVTIKNANTMIIFNSDMLGLAQLHQLRGRIGRGNNGTQSYCVLTYPKKKHLEPTAKERLKIMCENSYLGSGFKISEQNADIKGFGELIGIRQSGHLPDVGMEYYIEMLTRSVDKEKECV